MLELLTFVRVLAMRFDDKRHGQRGAITVEYGLVLVFIAIALAVAITALGTSIGAWLDSIAAAVTALGP